MFSHVSVSHSVHSGWVGISGTMSFRGLGISSTRSFREEGMYRGGYVQEASMSQGVDMFGGGLSKGSVCSENDKGLVIVPLLSINIS